MSVIVCLHANLCNITHTKQNTEKPPPYTVTHIVLHKCTTTRCSELSMTGSINTNILTVTGCTDSRLELLRTSWWTRKGQWNKIHTIHKKKKFYVQQSVSLSRHACKIVQFKTSFTQQILYCYILEPQGKGNNPCWGNPSARTSHPPQTHSTLVLDLFWPNPEQGDERAVSVCGQWKGPEPVHSICFSLLAQDFAQHNLIPLFCEIPLNMS